MSEIQTVNKDEVDSWVFNRAVNMGHDVIGVKGEINGEMVNIKFVDSITGESVDIVYRII